MKRGFPKIQSETENVKEVRIIPFGDRFNYEIIYDYEPEKLNLPVQNIMGIDLGLTNIVTTADNVGNAPLIIKGNVLKSVNQYYNKQLAWYKSQAKKCNNTSSTHHIRKIHRVRNNKIRDIFHKISIHNRFFQNNIL